VRFRCRNGHEWRSQRFTPEPGEQICPDCGVIAEPTLKARTGAPGRLREESSAEQEARREFSALVLEWPCWARQHRPCEGCGGRGFSEATGEVCAICNGDGKHHCRGRKNAHHLVPVDWMRDAYGDLPEADFLEIAFAPILGAPACQHNFHAALESRADVIHWHELDDEVKLFCQRIDAKYPDRPSMLERLRIESPTKGASRV
jgi:hypothetical protein